MSESGAVKRPDSDGTRPFPFEAVAEVSPEHEVGGAPSRLALVASFLAAFALAACAFILIGHYGFNVPRSLSVFDREAVSSVSEPIASPLVVSGSGIFEKVAADPALNPSKGTDFVFFIWFKLRKIPASGEYLGLAGKFDTSLKHRPGYAITLEGAPDGVRPRVYWNSDSENGKWYSFSTSHLRRKQWYLLAISFSNDAFLSAHIVPAEGAEVITLLGAHRIEPETIPVSNADISVGAFGTSRFRGQIGPFGVLTGEELSRDLQEYLMAMKAKPGEIPDELPRSVIQVWASPLRDIGPRALAVTPGSGPSKEVRPAVAERPKTAAVKGKTTKKKARHVGKKK